MSPLQKSNRTSVPSLVQEPNAVATISSLHPSATVNRVTGVPERCGLAAASVESQTRSPKPNSLNRDCEEAERGAREDLRKEEERAEAAGPCWAVLGRIEACILLRRWLALL